MADFEMSLDSLRSQVDEGKQYTLSESFYYNNNILIGTERILTPKDIDRLEGKVFENIRVSEYRSTDVDKAVQNEIVQYCLKVLKDHPDYAGLRADKKKRVQQIFVNILPAHKYMILRLSNLKKVSARLFVLSVNTAIKTILIDMAWQIRHNQGMQDSTRFEEILIASLFRYLGMLKTTRETISSSIGELRAVNDTWYKKIPELSIAILKQDDSKHEISPNSLRILAESFERADGSGFPQQIEKEQIHPLALEIGACDEFNLLLSGELSSAKRSFDEIIRRMTTMVDKFDRNIINLIAEEFRYLRETRG